MDTLRVLIVDGSEVFASALEERLQSTYRVRVCCDGTQALEVMRSFCADVVVLDLLMPHMDGISLLQKMAAEHMHPAVLVTTPFKSDYIMGAIEALGVGYIMMKPCDLKSVADRIADMSQKLQSPAVTYPDNRTVVSNLLLALNVPTKLHGYQYLREAILMMSREINQSITKELYPAVAAKCGGTSAQVERAIRSAVQAAWLSRDMQVWRKFFKPDAQGNIPRPTNAAFITRLANELVMDQENEQETMVG